MRFEGVAKKDAPGKITDFVTRFFESMKEDWRSGTRFMDPENHQELRSYDPKKDATLADASILVSAISLHRFHGSGDPPDTDGDIERLKAISRVRVTRFEQDEHVFRLYGQTELKDGRVYGLSLVISKASFAILGPL